MKIKYKIIFFQIMASSIFISALDDHELAQVSYGVQRTRNNREDNVLQDTRLDAPGGQGTIGYDHIDNDSNPPLEWWNPCLCCPIIASCLKSAFFSCFPVSLRD